MKKTISLVLSIVLLLSLTLTGCAAGETAAPEKDGIPEKDGMDIILQIGSPMMTVDGVEKEIDPGRDTVPIVVDDRTLVPIRAIVEEMGGSVEWEEATQTVSLIYGDDAIRLTIDSETAYFNGEVHTLDVAPTVIGDRTMLPIRFVAERFRFAVDWNEAAQTITITKMAAPTPEEPTVTSAPRVLAVYFSATGNTKSLAEKIAAASEADLYELVPEAPYTSEDLNYSNDACRANLEQQDENARPALTPLTVNLDDYDTILLGYPIWWGTLPKIIYTFAETYDLSGKTILPFCTSGGSTITSSVSALGALCPNSTVKEGFRGTGATTDAQIKQWLDENDFSAQGSNASGAAQNQTLNIQIGETVFTAPLVENSSTAALKELLAQGPLTIQMHDYGNFEKVGPLGTDLPRNDEQITTEPGDLILYQGNSFVIYYDTNSWNFTRLGKINNATQAELKEVLGNGDVTVTLSIK